VDTGEVRPGSFQVGEVCRGAREVLLDLLAREALGVTRTARQRGHQRKAAQRPHRADFAFAALNTSSHQLSDAVTFGNPIVLVSEISAWRISSGVTPSWRARLT